MLDYKKARIYKVRCKTNDRLIYVGSTTRPLSNDFQHTRHRKLAGYINIFTNILVEIGVNGIYNYMNKKSMIIMKNWIKEKGKLWENIATTNKNIAGRTGKEYDDDNREK